VSSPDVDADLKTRHLASSSSALVTRASELLFLVDLCRQLPVAALDVVEMHDHRR
jgi:hypothetical protein